MTLFIWIGNAMAILYLCGMAALDVTRYIRSVNGGEIPGRMPRSRRLGGALNKNADLDELSYDAQLVLSHVRGDIEALVPRHAKSNRTSRLMTREWRNQLPASAFIDLGNGIYLSSPQFLFLQLATVLDEVDLIALGMELCGFYSRWSFPDKKLRPSVEDEFKQATFEIQPAITAKKLEQFINGCAGMRGVSQARKAMKYILDNAASPMEAAVYLLLCLPRHRGGRGLPAPVFNARVRVPTSTTHDNRYPDLYWPARSLDVEYQSDYAHSGNWSRYRDSRREIELEAEKITVLPLTSAQLVEPDEFNSFAASVRRNLGVRSRPLPADWWSKYTDLRERLLWAS